MIFLRYLPSSAFGAVLGVSREGPRWVIAVLAAIGLISHLRNIWVGEYRRPLT